MADLNTWSDVSSIANAIQHDAYFIVREMSSLSRLITVFNDRSGMNLRKSYKYNSGTVLDVGDEDDLTSSAFTPSADQTLTPHEIGLQFFVTDARAESDLPEQIIADAAKELGFAALARVEQDIVDCFEHFTGGSGGTAAAAVTWKHISAAIAKARAANKNMAVPLSCVLHGNQWAVLANSASIAGASVVNAPGVADEMTRTGKIAEYMGVPMIQTFQSNAVSDDFNIGVFPKVAIALDWRRPIRIRPERDESRRGIEFNLSAIYDCNVWRPDLGAFYLDDATAPTGA
jgi:hypothetical protein